MWFKKGCAVSDLNLVPWHLAMDIHSSELAFWRDQKVCNLLLDRGNSRHNIVNAAIQCCMASAGYISERELIFCRSCSIKLSSIISSSLGSGKSLLNMSIAALYRLAMTEVRSLRHRDQFHVC